MLTHAAQSNVHFDQQIRDALKPMKSHLWLGLLGAFSLSVQAASLDVPINLVSADGAPKPIGSVTVSETQYGLLFTPKLTDLPAGVTFSCA